MSVRDQHEPATLVGLLDGLIDRGVHVSGDVVIGLADVELLRVALRLLVASEDTVQRTGSTLGRPPIEPPTVRSPTHEPGPRNQPRPSPRATPAAPRSAASAREGQRLGEPDGAGARPARPATSRVADADRDHLVRGVSQLVLTIVEVIRELLERQATRRVEAGSLSDDQVERLGVALQALEERMAELREVFGFDDDELNLDLGPLGRLR